MEARALQTFLGMDLSSDPTLLLVVAIMLMVVGLALAFVGRRVWKHVMSFIGAIIGGLLGFVFGAAVGGLIIGLLGGLVGSMIGGAVFVFLARLGIAIVAGVLALMVVGGVAGSDVVGLVAGLVVFIVTFVFAETAVGIVTAIVGGLLFGSGMYLLEIDMTLTVLAVLALAVFGGAFQMSVLKEEKDRAMMRRAARGTVAASAMSPPAAPAMPVRTCSRCGGQLTYIPEYNRYYCYHCQKYE